MKALLVEWFVFISSLIFVISVCIFFSFAWVLGGEFKRCHNGEK